MSTLEEYAKGLTPLKGKFVQTYCSSGFRKRASELAARAERARSAPLKEKSKGIGFSPHILGLSAR